MPITLLRRIVRFGLSLLAVGVSLAAATLPAPNPHWENEIKSIESRDRLAAPKEGEPILFVGSSSIRLWKTLQADFSDLRVYNHGFGGSYLVDSIAYADRIVFPLKPKAIVLYAGTNDINGGVAPEEVFENFKLFASLVREKLPSTRILYISIAPNPLRWAQRDKIQEANRLIADYIKQGENMDFIDVYAAMLGADGKPLPDIYVEDGLHMNAKGYAIWTQIIRPRL